MNDDDNDDWRYLVRTGDPETSRIAARRAKVPTWRAKVKAEIDASGTYGRTTAELVNKLGPASESSAHSRPIELIRMGLVVRLGDTRPGNTGLPQLVNRSVQFVNQTGMNMIPALYPYQADAIAKIAVAPKPVLNAFDPGLGKTRVALAVLDAHNYRRVLVVCPHSVLLVWEAEVAKWWAKAPPVTIIRAGLLIPEGEGVFLLSYGLISEASGRVGKRLQDTGPFQATILDEIHYLKNPRANRSKRIFDLIPRLGWVHPMSGTPAPNNAGELWGMLYHLRPDCIVSPVNGKPMYEAEFVSRYCTVEQFKVNGGRHWVTRITGSKNKQELRERIAPMVLRAKKADVLPDLPPLDFVVLPVQAQDAQAHWAATELDHLNDDALLAQLISGAAKSEVQQLGLAKIPAVVEWIADLLDSDPKRRLVLWAMHHRVIDSYVTLLAQYSPVKFDGRDSLDARRSAIERFMSGQARIFVGQIMAGGTGLTLVSETARCSDVVFAESSFSWTDNCQAACRVHRIGQMDGVLARYASAAGTLDDRIQQILARKSRDWVEVFG